MMIEGRLYNGRLAGSPWVDETRDDALEFSKDIAKGLLDYVIKALEERVAENVESLATIERAIGTLNTTRKH